MNQRRFRRSAAGRRFRFGVLGVLAAALVLVALGLARWRFVATDLAKRDSSSANETSPSQFSLQPPDSPHPNQGSEARYVGSAACAECHADQHQSLVLTRHGQSMSVVDPAREPADGSVDHPPANRRYEIYRLENRLRQRELMPLPSVGAIALGDFSLEYLIGSGRFARTYALRDGEFFVEAPVTWYQTIGQWGMSPGFDGAYQRSFHRSIEFDCLFCHAGEVEMLDQNPHRVRLHELGISCERCHGPGSLHMSKHATASAPKNDADDEQIANPRKLPREFAEAICHQCHLTSDVQVAVRGRSKGDFRPGRRWQDYAIDFGPASTSQEMTVVGHVAQLRASRCYQQSDSLTCLTCHDPHAVASAQESVGRHRSHCLQCHTQTACGVSHSERDRENGNDCAKCHMPQSGTDVPHIAFTHHRIGVHKATKQSPENSQRSWAPLVSQLDISHHSELDRDLALGLAYLQRYRNSPDAPTAARDLSAAQPLLAAVLARGIEDGRIALAMAELAAARSDLAQAEHWGRRTLNHERAGTTERISALRLVGGLELRSERIGDARERFDELALLARDPRDWMLLAICRQRLGDVSGAIAALERVLEIDPAQPETYELLAPLYAATGNKEQEQFCRQRAEVIRRAREKR